MGIELEVTQSKLNTALNSSFNNASAIITKDYLDKLESYDLVVPSEEDIDIDIADCGKFYKLTKLVLNREENFLQKLTTIVNVISSINCSLATIINSDGYKIDYYFGIISKNARTSKELNVKRRLANAAAFRGALLGNLIGSELEEVPTEHVCSFRENTLLNDKNCFSSVSGIVALRDADNKSIDGYVQGIENLVDSLKGQKYTIIMLSDPVKSSEIQVKKQGYEILYTQLSAFAHRIVTINESDTLSLSKARTDGISEGISKGIAMTQSRTKSKGKYFGGNASIGVNVGVTASIGFSAGVTKNTADSTGQTDSTSQQHQKSNAITDTTSSAKTTGQSLQLSYDNRSVKALLDKIDMHLKRLDECESFGTFECAAYVITENRETALTVASNYNALMRGKDSSVQASHINSWYKADDTKVISKYIGSLVHPRFWQSKENDIIVTPASIVSGDELAIQIGLPKKSVTGITVVSMAPFGRNIIKNSDRNIVMGNLYHMGHDEGSVHHKQDVSIDIESLAMHTFITGSTGSGKSTAIYSVLDKLMTQDTKDKNGKISFLVIEPAKGEYKNRFASYPDVKVFGTNHKKMPLLRINPFSFPDDIHVLEHIDRLIEIFNVCWPMYAAMPAVLKDAIERAYALAGWNLESSECKYKDSNGNPLFPSFIDVQRQITVVMEESAYSSDSKGDYKGALCTRLKSLINGLYRQIFTSDELTGEELFDSNVIVDLSRVGSSETKSLIMGILVIKLQEYRMANTKVGNVPLRHVTVLEEAHNILKSNSTAQSSEISNISGKSVEMLSNSIAEMRTYGEGFIIADQAPGSMDMSVIRNTNTKIILRLPDLNDRILVGKAANLNDDQISELSRLKTFVAAVYQNNWIEPVLCNIDTNFKDVTPYRYEQEIQPYCDKTQIIEYLLLPLDKRDELDKKYVSQLIDHIFKLSVSAESKLSFIKYTQSVQKDEIQKFRGQIVYDIFNSDTAFGLAKKNESDIESWFFCIRESLEPSITFLSLNEQEKIIAMLAREKVLLDNTPESQSLFERLMKHL